MGEGSTPASSGEEGPPSEVRGDGSDSEKSL